MKKAKPKKTAKQIANAKYRADNKDALAEKRRAWRKTAAGKAAKKRWKKSDAAKDGAARWAAKPSTREQRKRYKENRRKYRDPKTRRFVGCDGEGIGDGANHSYVLLRIGSHELYRDGARLTTPDMLQFITDYPHRFHLLVGFSFEYDVSSILRDCTARQRARLMAAYEQPASDKPAKGRPGAGWVWLDFPGYPRFGVNWLAKNHFRVCRADMTKRKVSDRQTVRTIFDTFGFFQCSFVKALKNWNVGEKHKAFIEKMKAQRGSWPRITKEIRRYNALECKLLADMMEKFRDTCADRGLFPRTWNGAGKLASYLHKTHGTIRAADLKNAVPVGVIRAAHAAYYGGRFEITRAGRLAQPVWEHDINSAYPAGMLALPCLTHGTWKKTAGEILGAVLGPAGDPDAIFVAPARFEHKRDAFLCGLPFRDRKKGGLCWPRMGNGVYWSNELRSALALGAEIELRAGWLYERQCDCRPFAWVAEIYRQRKTLSEEQGIPLKLGANSLYGKLAQRIGDPPYKNPIWAGLITASCRAQINYAIAAARDPRDVAMIATDGIYTIAAPLPLPHSEELGEWKIQRHDCMFIVQPGLYWTPPREGKTGIKSRGLAASTLEKYRAEFETLWDAYAHRWEEPDGEAMAARLDALDHAPRAKAAKLAPFAFHNRFPAVKVKFSAFIGLRYAAHNSRPEWAGTWQEQIRKVSFDWSGKRQGKAEFSADRSHVITAPAIGYPGSVSTHYLESGQLSSSAGWEIDRMLLEASPDMGGDDDD